MKRLRLVLAGTLALATLGNAPAASAAPNWWPWGHHSKSKAAAAEASPAPKSKPKKAKAPKAHGQKVHHDKPQPLYSVPKSVGWWHKGPGPAGAGAK